MKKLFLTPIVLFVLIFFSGCVSQEAKTTSQEAVALSQGYIKSMKSGKTTPAQDQAHIISQDLVIQAINSALNGSANTQYIINLINPPSNVSTVIPATK